MDLDHKKLLRRLYNLAENNPDRSGCELGIKAVKGFMYILHEWIDRCLDNNRVICSLVANLPGNRHCFTQTDTIQIKEQNNVRFLLQPSDMPDNIDLYVDTNYIQQCTDKWHEVGKCSVITGSSAHSAIGLQTLKEQKLHVSMHVQHKE